jgi:uncharacterized protein YkwD
MSARRSQWTTLAVVIAVIAAASSVIGAATAPAHAKMSLEKIQAMDADTYEKRVHTLINTKRAKRGRRALTFHACPDSFSETWARHLADTGGFTHQRIRPILRRCNARYAGEVLGRGYWSPAQMVRAWMRSTPHRRILLKRKPNRLGVGAVLDSKGRWVVTANTAKIRR